MKVASGLHTIICDPIGDYDNLRTGLVNLLNAHTQAVQSLKSQLLGLIWQTAKDFVYFICRFERKGRKASLDTHTCRHILANHIEKAVFRGLEAAFRVLELVESIL